MKKIQLTLKLHILHQIPTLQSLSCENHCVLWLKTYTNYAQKTNPTGLQPVLLTTQPLLSLHVSCILARPDRKNGCCLKCQSLGDKVLNSLSLSPPPHPHLFPLPPPLCTPPPPPPPPKSLCSLTPGVLSVWLFYSYFTCFFSFFSSSVAKHISVGHLFKNVHPALHYASCSLIHASLCDLTQVLPTRLRLATTHRPRMTTSWTASRAAWPASTPSTTPAASPASPASPPTNPTTCCPPPFCTATAAWVPLSPSPLSLAGASCGNWVRPCWLSLLPSLPQVVTS